MWLVCSLQRIARKWRASNYKRTQLSVFLAVRTPIRMLRQICIKKLRTAHVRKTHANASTCSQRTRGDALCCKKESCRQFGRDIGGIKRRYRLLNIAHVRRRYNWTQKKRFSLKNVYFDLTSGNFDLNQVTSDQSKLRSSAGARQAAFESCQSF